MILDKIENCTTYAGLSEHFRKAFDYLATGAYKQLPVGRHPIDGDNVYISVQKNALKPWEQGAWEGHRNYADIQIVIDGQEIMGVRSLGDTPVSQPYDAARDVLFCQADAEGIALPMESGDFCVLFSQDLHRPNIRRENGPTESLRAVVKVKL